MNRPLLLHLFGPPSGGKGTQAKLLLERHECFRGAFHLSTGEMLRQGELAKSQVATGDLADNPLICGLVAREIANCYGVEPLAPIILDGCVRAPIQARLVLGLAYGFEYNPLTIELEFDSISECRLRARGRGRVDDADTVFRRRATLFQGYAPTVREAWGDDGPWWQLPVSGKNEDQVYEGLCELLERYFEKFGRASLFA